VAVKILAEADIFGRQPEKLSKPKSVPAVFVQ
jgi:hypothetical protein